MAVKTLMSLNNTIKPKKKNSLKLTSVKTKFSSEKGTQGTMTSKTRTQTSRWMKVPSH